MCLHLSQKSNFSGTVYFVFQPSEEHGLGAKAMMDDYQNDTCVGKYLKEIHKRRVPKNLNKKHTSEPHYNRTKSYGGQFHFDYPGLKDKAVFGMGGYGGRAILIDMENSRIVVLNSLHYNHDKFKYNHKKLLIDLIKNGK